MGGTALGFQGIRLPAKEYFTLISNVNHAFNMGWSGYLKPPGIGAIPAYKEKESFGDADFLFTGRSVDWERFTSDFAAFVPGFTGDVYRNGSVVSIGVQLPEGVFQVDFIYAGEDVDAARVMRCYFSYNDLGNLMGRIAHRMGLRWGQDGLSYVLRSPTNHDRILGEYNLTRQLGIPTSFAIMGYDHGRFTGGFTTLESVFEYAASSPYFSPDIFLLHNRNAISRARDAKRKTYNQFLAWVQEKASELPSMDLREEEREAFKAETFNDLCLKYPDFASWYHSTMMANAVRERVGVHLNGSVVGASTGLQGRPLGVFMVELRNNLHAQYVDSFSFGETIPGAIDFGFNRWLLQNLHRIPETIEKLSENI